MVENKKEVINHHGVSKDALLTAVLFEGRGLRGDNYIGDFDPYLVFSLDGEKYISSTKPNNLDPVWNEDFSLYLLIYKS